MRVSSRPIPAGASLAAPITFGKSPPPSRFPYFLSSGAPDDDAVGRKIHSLFKQKNAQGIGHPASCVWGWSEE